MRAATQSVAHCSATHQIWNRLNKQITPRNGLQWLGTLVSSNFLALNLQEFIEAYRVAPRSEVCKLALAEIVPYERSKV